MKKEYTPDEIAAIKANLMAAFGTDKIEVQVKLKSLFKDKPFDIRVDEHYYVYFPYDIDEFNKKKGWHEFIVTYVRSGVVFFRFKGGKKEHYFLVDSSFAGNLIPAVIDLQKYGIPDSNVEVIKFNKGKCPFALKIKKQSGEIIKCE